MAERLIQGSRVGALDYDNGTCLAPATVLSADGEYTTVYADTVDEPAATHFTPSGNRWSGISRVWRGPAT